MINRFKKITDGLYRGSAPSENDVKNLKKYFGINKIISLDKSSGEEIAPICRQLGIKHIMLPLKFNKHVASLLNLFKHNLHDLLLNDGPTFIHCRQGKDRTGLVAAIFQCLYLDYTFEEAIAEAESLGFGTGVDPEVIEKYINIIHQACSSKDPSLDSPVTISDNQRSYKNPLDNRGSYLDQATQGSFAPYLSKTKQYPYDNVYNELYDQSPTRSNYGHGLSPYVELQPVDLPLVGYYNNNAGIRGVGPAENYGGFIYD